MNWTIKELIECTAYGTLYAVAKVDRHIHAHRVRTRKGELVMEAKAKKFYAKGAVERGHLLFIEKSGAVQQLFPEAGLAAMFSKAFERGKI